MYKWEDVLCAEAASATFPQNEAWGGLCTRCLNFKREQYTKNRSLLFSLKFWGLWDQCDWGSLCGIMWWGHRRRSGTEFRGRLQPREQLGAGRVHPSLPIAVWSGSDWNNRNHRVRARAGGRDLWSMWGFCTFVWGMLFQCSWYFLPLSSNHSSSVVCWLASLWN